MAAVRARDFPFSNRRGQVAESRACLLDLIKSKELHPMFKVVAMADLVHLADKSVLADPVGAETLPAMAIIAAGKDSPRMTAGESMRSQAAVPRPGRKRRERHDRRPVDHAG